MKSTQTQLRQDKLLYKKAKKAYYNSQPIMTDAEFDKLEDRIKREDPNWSELHKTGTSVADKKTEVALEFFMPSLHKVYPDKADAWLGKHDDTDLLLHKLDGSSLQLTYDKGVPRKLVTRGDGERGGDISFLLPYIDVPRSIPHLGKIVLRCEGIMTKKKFAKWAQKPGEENKEKFDTARNMVAGIMNRMTPHPGLADVDVVVLGVFNEEILVGLNKAKRYGFKIVGHSQLTNVTLDAAYLSKVLAKVKAESPYEMDGIVMCSKHFTMSYNNADRPKKMVAFKENVSLEDALQATVVDVIWQESRLGRVIPKIKIKPLRIGGVLVTYATAHNAKWLRDRSIGPGAIVKLVRSGDVIPKIVDVVRTGAFKAPNICYQVEGVHFISQAVSADTRIKRMVFFFKTLGIDFIAESTVRKLYEGGIKTHEQFLVECATAVSLQRYGIGKAMSAKIFSEVNRVTEIEGVPLYKLMVASGAFDAGIGERKLLAIEKSTQQPGKSVLSALLRAHATNVASVRKRLESVPGFASKTIEAFMVGINTFRKSELRNYVKVVAVKAKQPKNGKLLGKKISFTGYRDADQEKAIIDAGGEVVSFGSKTDVLLIKPDGKSSGKVTTAKEKGIRVCNFEELRI